MIYHTYIPMHRCTGHINTLQCTIQKIFHKKSDFKIMKLCHTCERSRKKWTHCKYLYAPEQAVFLLLHVCTLSINDISFPLLINVNVRIHAAAAVKRMNRLVLFVIRFSWFFQTHTFTHTLWQRAAAMIAIDFYILVCVWLSVCLVITMIFSRPYHT